MPTAVILGSGEMPVQCARLLQRAGYLIVSAHSPGEPLRRWAAENNVKHDEWPDFRIQAGQRVPAPDLLVSVTNFRILPPAVYQHPGLAINYHDAPLPRYAGSHAVKWALHNREAEHGVTWHAITETVDAGDILAQRKFPIEPGDDERSLSQKCYLHGMRLFRELIENLKTGEYTRTPQDLSRRTYYAASDLPPVAL